MPTISTFYGILIQMFWNDHPPPHFHAMYSEDEVKINIRTLEALGRTHERLGIMLEQSTSTQDSPSAITPELRSRMPWRVVEVSPLEGFRFYVRFVDGTTGTVDLSELIRSPCAGVFARLADPAVFAQVFVEHGAVTWPGELDLAPDSMYDEIKKNGEWILK